MASKDEVLIKSPRKERIDSVYGVDNSLTYEDYCRREAARINKDGGKVVYKENSDYCWVEAV